MKLAILYEHPSWFRSLFDALDRRGIEFVEIDPTRYSYDPNLIPNDLLVFNRMSASAYLRGNQSGLFLTKNYLHALETAGRKVINGHRAYEVEISKAMQAAIVGSLGLRYPRTRVASSLSGVFLAASELRFPIIVKPNMGGRGAGIVKFDSSEELASAVDAMAIDVGIDSVLLVQEFMPKLGGSVQRVEILDKKFLYALRIFPGGENFNLCPAEVCVTDRIEGAACLADAPAGSIKVEPFEPPTRVLQDVERIAAAASMDIGSVEYLIDEESGEPFFYDINALSNFVANAKELIGFDPNDKLVDFLERELKK